MKRLPLLLLLLLACGWSRFAASAAGTGGTAGHYFQVDYPPSTAAGELKLGVTYTVWIPTGVRTLRGVIVHQHGCGAGACRGGETAAYDLQWQALARKWDCALLGPSYHQRDDQDCALWYDPRNGSDRAFLRALHELSEKSGHPELKQAPWCLWGHSGGGFWSSLMQTLHPERIAAIWFRSGTAFQMWESGRITKPQLPDAAMQIPMMVNPGAKEKGDSRFDAIWNGCLAMFHAYRAKGAPIGFAPDPRTTHECGDSRYLAIPFFDACLAMRLPRKPGEPLKKVNMEHAWLAALLGTEARPAAEYQGNQSESVWLPNERVAHAWSEYVKTGAVSDQTPPPAPTHVQAARTAEGVEITWDATADLESGLRGFVVQRDGQEMAQVPEKPVGRFGRPLFQVMSYHDTPEAPLPRMRYVDTAAKPGETHRYAIIAVNSVGLKSSPSRAAHQRATAAPARLGLIPVAHQLEQDPAPETCASCGT